MIQIFKNAARWFLATLVILSSLTSIHAQISDYREIFWMFGQSDYHITFKKSDFTAELDSIQNPDFGIGGSAVATDPITGELLFYTDGNRVYDRSHQLINGYAAGLNGNTNANQPAAVTALPGLVNQYLIIANSATNTAGGIISTARIDMNAQGNAPNASEPPYGRMLGSSNSGLTNNASEGMIVVGNQGGTRSWLITQDRNSATFRVTPIINTGLDVANSTVYDFSSDGMPPVTAANLAYSLAAGKIAVSPQDINRNVHLISFNSTTGTLTYDRPVLNSATDDPDAVANDTYSIYDTEWSPDGTKLYISRHGNAGQAGMVYQYDLINPGTSLSEILPGPVFRSYGLKRGPDNIIYHLFRQNSGGPLLAGSISAADSLAAQVVYTVNPFGSVNFNGRQFAETLPFQIPEFTNFGFTAVGDCYGTSTKFYPLIEPQASAYQWDFGDGNTSNLISPIHEYEDPGIYNITLRATLNGRDSVYTGMVNILESDTLVLRSESGSELPMDTTICPDEILLLDASQPMAIEYRWSVRDHTEATYTVDTAGYYWVVGTYNTPNGTCTSYDAINVNEYGFQLQVQNQWYFGFQAGIDFNEQPPVALLDGAMSAPEGVAAISDRNGEILFYTDGETVFGRTGAILGTFIGGDQTASQSVIAIPFPQDETMYYIFTTREVYNSDDSYLLSYSILDIKEITGNDPGAVVLQELPLYEKNTERITAIGGYGNNAILVTHEYGNNTFRLYPITEDGIGNPILQSIGSVHGFGSEESAEGYMKFSPGGSKLAVALSINGNNYVDLFDYEDTTATLSNHQLINFDEPYPDYQVYGIEFSPGGDKMYVSLTGSTSKIYEFRLDSANTEFINSTKNLLAEENARFGALQIGPDGQIYVASDGSSVLPIISPNDDPDTPSTFRLQGFDLQGRTSGLGLPNFIQNIGTGIGGPTAAVTGFCVGQETTFSGQPTSDIDMFQWQVIPLGDSTIVFSDTQLNTTYVFQQSGDYTVNFRVTNRCGLDTTITQVISILDPPADPTIPEAFSICTGDEVLEAAPAGSTGLTYLWNDGSTGRTLPVTEPGIYSVVIAYDNPAINGCTSTAETFVADGRPEFDIGPDITVCQDENVADLATGLNPTSYIFDWNINAVQSSVTRNRHPVDTSVPGEFTYTVEVEDNLTTCFARDTAVVTVNPAPDLAFDITNSTCGNNTGEVVIPSTPPNTEIVLTDRNGDAVALTGLAAGAYTLTAQSQITGCINTFPVNIIDTDANFTVNATPINDCDFGTIAVELTGETYPVSYRLIQRRTGFEYSGDILSSDPKPLPLPHPLDTGTWDLEINSDGCVDFAEDLDVVRPPSTVIDVEPDYSNCEGSVTIDPDPSNSNPANTNYRWFGPGLPSQGTQTRIFSTSGEGIFTVRSENSGICDSEETFEVIVLENPNVTIGVDGDGCGTAKRLTANIDNQVPGNNYSYLWSNGTVGETLILPAPATGDFQQYQNISVIVANQQNGCQGNAGPIDETTYQDYSVFLTASIACDDGSPVSLTANILNISSSNIDSYSWSGPDPNAGNLTTRVVQVNAEGTYEVTTEWSGCEKNAEIMVLRNPVTESNIDPLYQICSEPPANETVIIDVGDFVTYSMLNIVTNSQLIEFEPNRYEIMEEGLYRGRGSNTYGCVTTDTFAVQLRCVPQLFAPNAFRPESNIPENRVFSVDGIYIADDFQIIIYNRWGEPVYESQDKNFAWDGTRNGVLLPNGTYPYLVRFRSITDNDPRIYEQRGGVTLIR
jgi:large repetitive protein